MHFASFNCKPIVSHPPADGEGDGQWLPYEYHRSKGMSLKNQLKVEHYLRKWLGFRWRALAVFNKRIPVYVPFSTVGFTVGVYASLLAFYATFKRRIQLQCSFQVLFVG